MPYSRLYRCLAGALLALAGASASGQAAATDGRRTAITHRVAGVVLDTTGAPVTFADIRLTAMQGWQHRSFSDGSGHFDFTSVPFGAVRIEVRRLGFRPVVGSLLVGDENAAALNSTQVILAAIAIELASIDVNDRAPDRDPALAGFYARRHSNNFGHYLDRAEIEATHAQRPSDALRSVPGLMIQPSRRIGNIVRIRNCRPTVWLDGIRVPDAELDEVTSVDDVAAVEIYKSLAGLPQQFIDRTNPCGGILIWSRNH